MTPPAPTAREHYIVSKADLDELLTELAYHRYNNAKIIENRIRARPAPANLNQQMAKQLREASALYRAGLKDGREQAHQPHVDALETLKNLVLLKHTRHGCINVGELIDCIEALQQGGKRE